MKNNNCLVAKDYLVTSEKFELRYNEELDLLYTNPKPAIHEMSVYYQSEEYISHTDKSTKFIEVVYKFVQYFTIKNKVNLVKKISNNCKTILDIGCGTGDFLKTCYLKKIAIYGIEPHLNARNLAAEKLRNKGHIFSDIENLHLYHQTNHLPVPKFDVITLWHVLEHVDDYNLYIDKIKELLNPNGTIIIAVPNFKSYDAKHYKEFWAAYDVPRHLWHFSKNSIHKIFALQQMKVVKILPMIFDAFYIAILSEKYKNGKTNYIKAFFVGLYSNLKAFFTKEYSSHIYIIKNDNFLGIKK